MEFLSKENEALLKECIDNNTDFPRVLRCKFEGLSPVEDDRLRGQIKALVDMGFLSKMHWGDNVPLYGRIEQKGYDYFKQREIYIRAKLRQDPCFVLLDDESERILSELQNNTEPQVLISGDISLGRVYENLCKYGFVKLPDNGLSYDMSGEFVGFISLTQKGIMYFTDKENRIEEILALGDEAITMTKVDHQYNISGNSISDSQFQIGDHNSQYVNTGACVEALNELKSQIETLKISSEQTEKLNVLIEEAQGLSKRNDKGGVKRVLNEIWEFAKQTGSQLLVAYLMMKFGLGQ